VNQDLTLRALFGYNSDDQLDIENHINGGNVQIRARDTGGTLRTGLIINPDTTTTVVADTNVQIFSGATTEVGRFNISSTAGDVRFMVYDVDNGTLQQVSIGADDSGGTGFKVLRITN